MKRCLKIIAATAVAISIFSCARPYDQTPIPDTSASGLPAGSNATDCDFYVLFVNPAGTGVNFLTDTSYGRIKMSGIGYNDASNVASLKVTITVDRVKKTAIASIDVIYANEADTVYSANLIGGVVQGTATAMTFTVKDDYTSGVLVNVNVLGATATVSMRETNPLYSANGAFLDNVVFQVNPKAS